MLKNKIAVIYGVSQSLGGAVAKAMARAGASVFLSNRHMELAEEVAHQIRLAGGEAESATVDAMDERAVQKHLEHVVRKAGRIDISFNLIGLDVVQNIPLIECRSVIL